MQSYTFLEIVMGKKPRRHDMLCLSILDTTFRDGIQALGVEATSLAESLVAVKAIDSLDVEYLELGFALGNEMAQQRIRAALDLGLQAKVAAFGRTHLKDVEAIIELGVPVAVLVAKSRLRDVEVSLRQKPEEYLNLVSDLIDRLISSGIEIIFDAEHFFQAVLESHDNYPFQLLQVAHEAGASRLVLCDTNGSMTPQKIFRVIDTTQTIVPIEKLGIHTHNDRGRAIACAEVAVEAGISHVQGTIGGVGERTGNMDLCTFLPNAYLDLGVLWPREEHLRRLSAVYLSVCDALNIQPDRKAPYVGSSAFYTEAGMHQSGLSRDDSSYLHCSPSLSGNHARVGVSSQSGRANFVAKAKELSIGIAPDQLDDIVRQHDKLVVNGWDFGLADASFHLFLLSQVGSLNELFHLINYEVDDRHNQPSEARVKVVVGGQEYYLTAEGDGPVNALDLALRKALIDHYPQLESVRLVDFKVRNTNGQGSASRVRVVVEFTDGRKTWTTLGVHENMVAASWQALFDAYTYELAINGHSK